jgi:hypothetical protein
MAPTNSLSMSVGRLPYVTLAASRVTGILSRGGSIAWQINPGGFDGRLCVIRRPINSPSNPNCGVMPVEPLNSTTSFR